MNLKQAIAGCLLGASLIAARSASAAVVYVDATDGPTGNTALAPPAGGGVWTTNSADAVDAIWRLRTTFGQSPTATTVPSAAFDTAAGTIYESAGTGSGTDNVPRLVTTATVPSGIYNVYAYFWSDQNGSPWRLRASLVDDLTGPLPLFVGGGAPAGTPLPVDTGGRDGAARVLWRASLGLSGGTSIKVYVEDGPATQQTERTWYDGIGYELVPEPTSGVLLTTCALVGLVRRRRRCLAT